MYSFSQIQLFAQCPRKYQYKYIEKIPTEFESSPDLLLGQAVHATLEYLYDQVNIFKVPTLEKVLEYFHTTRTKLYDEATVEKPLKIKGDATIEEYIGRGEYYISGYYKKYSPFADIKVIATEEKVVFSLDPAGTKKFQGYIDRLDKEGDTFVINDYKTNKKLPTEDKEEYTDQLTLYGLALSQKYAKYFTHIKARLHYLHFDITDEWAITPEGLDKVVKKYSTAIDSIEDKRFHLNMGDKYAFAPKQNPFCNYCEYFSLCPLWAHMKFDDEAIGGDLGSKTVKGLVDEYVALSKEETSCKGQKEMIKDLLIDYAQKHDMFRLFGKISKISLSASDTLSITDKEKLKEMLTQLGILNDVLEIDRFKVQKLIKGKKIDPEVVKGLIDISKSWRLTGSDNK